MEVTVKENIIIWTYPNGNVGWLRCTCSGRCLRITHLLKIGLYRIFCGYCSTALSALLSTRNHLPVTPSLKLLGFD